MAMRREFLSREDLIRYCREQFPFAAAVDSKVSETRGGRQRALAKLGEMEPARYGFTRNYLDGAVTRLSAYIRHGVLSLREVLETAIRKVDDPRKASKLVSELAWRDYWRRLHAKLGDGIFEDREPYKTGFAPSEYAPQLPGDIAEGQTGLACMDVFIRQLRETGYMHNHARMWFAAYVVHWRRIEWRAGADFFLEHLLDGDAASNHLSWQWVASTFSHKPYFFNKESLEKYTGGVYCKDCTAVCPFDAPYADLSARLFQIEVVPR